MKKTPIKSWDQVSIEMYKALANVTEEDPILRNIEYLSILNDLPTSHYKNLTINQLKEHFKQIQFLFTQPKKSTLDLKHLRLKLTNSITITSASKANVSSINTIKCKVMKNLDKFSYAQYVDFQAITSTEEQDLARLLSVFLVPEGYKYNEGYDIEEFIQLINSSLPITQAQDLSFFLSKSLMNSTKRNLTYYKVVMKMMKREHPEMEVEFDQLNQHIEDLTSILGSLYSKQLAK